MRLGTTMKVVPLLVPLIGLALACRESGEESTPTGDGAGGALGSAGGSGGQGGAGRGGASGGSGGSRGVTGGAGGGNANGGAPGAGGASSGSAGMGGAVTGASFDAAASQDTRAASSDAGQPDRPALDAAPGPQRSVGCGMTQPGEGNQAITAGGKSRNYFLRLPKTYDNARAYPVLFGFHGAMRTSQDFVSDRGSYAFGPVAGEAAILVYPDALPDGQGTTSWTRDVRDDLAFFDAVLAELKGKLCVDTTRVFATGHSSGGFFSNALGCQRSGVVRAIGPVAGGLLGTSGCTQQSVAAFLVHGTIDSQVSVSLGQRARDYWIMRDGCMAANPMPAMPAPCVAYQGCRPGFPVAWCQHAETAYSGTGHAWPTWATKAIWNFFASL